MTDDKEDALAWFLAGFAASGEGFNPDVLTDWDREDHPVRERFEAQYPEPEYADAVRDREAQAAFNRKVEREGLFAALPKVDRETGEHIPPFDGVDDPDAEEGEDGP